MSARKRHAFAAIAEQLERLAAAYGLSVVCDECGALEWWPCITPTGRVTAHSRRATKAAAAIAPDDSPAPQAVRQ
jgi:hypothetical protein